MNYTERCLKFDTPKDGNRNINHDTSQVIMVYIKDDTNLMKFFRNREITKNNNTNKGHRIWNTR